MAVRANVAYNRGSYDIAFDKVDELLDEVKMLVEMMMFDLTVGYNHAGHIETRADNLLYFIDKYVIGLED